MFSICRHQLKMSLVSVRFYIALFIGAAVQVISVMDLFDFSKALGKPLCILEGFIYFSTERYTVAAAFLGIMMIVSEIPFSSENEIYLLMRVSRKKWLAGKVLYLLCVCVIYYLAVLLAGMAYLSGSAYAADFWSEPFYMMAQNMDFSAYNVYFPYPHVLLLTPVQAVLIGAALQVLYGFVMSLFLFLCNLKLPRAVGYACTMLVHLMFYMILSAFGSLKYTRYSLLGQSLLMYHEIGGRYRELFLPLWQSFLLFAFLIGLLVFFIFLAIKKYDFRTTVRLKQ